MEHNVYDFAGFSGHHGNDLSEHNDLHTYQDSASQYNLTHGVNHAYHYELDENDEETIEESVNHLHKLIVKEVVDFCKRHNLNDVDVVNFSIDSIQESVKFSDWHASSDSNLTFVDENGNVCIESI